MKPDHSGFRATMIAIGVIGSIAAAIIYQDISENKERRAIVAALPVKPGDLVKHRADGTRAIVLECFHTKFCVVSTGCDPHIRWPVHAMRKTNEGRL